MPAFKPKSSKKIEVDNRCNITLDNKHKEFINKFKNNKNIVIPKLEKYKQELLLNIQTKKH